MPDDFDPFKQGAIAVDPDTFDPFKQGAIAVDPAPSTSPLSEKAVTDTQDWMRTMVLQNPRGLIEPGNIDLYHRPIVQNADGSLDAVRPQSVGIDGREVLLPSVAGDGRHLTVPEMVDTYRKTNQHLGIFDNPANATSYAEILHQQQNQLYGPHGVMRQAKEPVPGMARPLSNETTEDVLQQTYGLDVPSLLAKAAPPPGGGYVGRGEFAPEAGRGPFGLTKEDLAKMHPSERAFTETTGQVTEAIAKNVVGMFPTSIAAAGEMATPLVSGIQGIMKPFDRIAYDNAIAQFQGKPVPHPEAMPKTFDQFGKEDWINFGVGMGIQGINAFLLGRGMGEAPGLTAARELAPETVKRGVLTREPKQIGSSIFAPDSDAPDASWVEFKYEGAGKVSRGRQMFQLSPEQMETFRQKAAEPPLRLKPGVVESAPYIFETPKPITGGEISTKRTYETAAPVSTDQALPVVD